MKRRPPESPDLREVILKDPLDAELDAMGAEVAELVAKLEKEEKDLAEDNAQIAIITQALEGEKEQSDVITELGNLAEEAMRTVVRLGKKLRRFWTEPPLAPPQEKPPEQTAPAVSDDTPTTDKKPGEDLTKMEALIESDSNFRVALAEAGKLPPAEMVKKKIALMKAKLISAGLLPPPPTSGADRPENKPTSYPAPRIIVEDPSGNPIDTPPESKAN